SSALAGDPVGGNPRPQPPVNFGAVGQEVLDESFAFTVTSFECGTAQISRTPQGKFCFLAITVRNTGRNPLTFQARAQMLQDNQQRTFGPDVAATGEHPANAGRDVLSPVINPGNELRGTLVYDVPAQVTLVAATLRAGPTGPGAYVKLS